MQFKGRKHYERVADTIEIFHRNLHGVDIPEISGRTVDIDHLITYVESKIEEQGLQVVSKEESKVTIVAFTQYPDREDYDIYGVFCFIGKHNKIDFIINYCGVCGDVNQVNVTSGEHVKFYCK